MHPIERLRYVARASDVPSGLLARETAMALADFVGDDAALQIACQRILARQPTAGALAWLAAHVLSAPEPHEALWAAVDQLEDDRTASALVYELPDNARITMVGWPDVADTLARRRGDISLFALEIDHAVDRRLVRFDDDEGRVEGVPVVGAAQAIAESTHLLVEVDALGPESCLVPQPAYASAAVAKRMGVEVWAVSQAGSALPDKMFDGVIRRWHAADDAPIWLRDEEDMPADLLDIVVTTRGAGDVAAAIAGSGCPIVPELF